MTDVNDGFDSYYAERLWQLLPGVYRSADTTSLDTAGPLRELIERIGAQMAVVRRSIDQLWEDQSIESCADWVIPYLGDLLGSNLVNNLAPRGQRLDVAKTIHYRRHKGTVQVLEELGGDVTGWGCVVVEAFRRLARTRHGLDPAFGPLAYPGTPAEAVSELLGTQGLTGRLTGTPAGGYADLRSAPGAALTAGAFDEYFHTADLRAGEGAVGHYGIPKLLVFLWRLRCFAVTGATPVPVSGQPGTFTCDPTGRDIPLFLAPPEPAISVGDYSEAWTAPLEVQVPGPWTQLTESAPVPPPMSLSGEATIAEIAPEHGRFTLTTGSAAPGTVDYLYAFSSTLGAGTFDRDLLGNPPLTVAPETHVAGGSGLDGALSSRAGTGTVTISDSQTYTALGVGSGPITSLLLRAGPGQRPVLRPGPLAPAWVFTASPGAELTLDGLTLSGCDVVLRGAFSTVRITGCTIDPGTADRRGPGYATAADGRSLSPSRIYVEADPDAGPGAAGGIGQLLIDHSILGPVRTRFGGTVESVSISDSIIQDLARGTPGVFDPVLLAHALLAGRSAPGSTAGGFPPAAAILGTTEGLDAALETYLAATADVQRAGLPAIVTGALAEVLAGPSFYTPERFVPVTLSPPVAALVNDSSLDASQTRLLNAGLLADAFPIALSDAALAVADAQITLARATVIGRIATQQLDAADSIIAGFATSADTERGCLRFSAIESASSVGPTYESVVIGPGAGLFTSIAYGDPGYGQLVENADALILAGAGASIAAGAENGSEMGAFCADLNPLKQQGLLTKYDEFMPLGLEPVIVHVT